MIMRKHLASLPMLLGLTAFIGAAEPSLREHPQAGVVDLRSVTVSVVDRDSGEPVKEFRYLAFHDAPCGNSPPEGDAGWTEFKRGGEPLQVRQSPGVVVSARVVVPEALRDGVNARLILRRDKSEIERQLDKTRTEGPATRTASISPDGVLRFENVRPDQYRLIIKGRGVAATNLAIDVTDADLDLGTLRIDGLGTATGRIEGRVWHPRTRVEVPGHSPMGMLSGNLVFAASTPATTGAVWIQADENGCFTVERVPVGLTTVGFAFTYSHVIDYYTWSAVVVEGQTTVVRPFEPDGRGKFTLAFAVGNGSKSALQSGTGLGAARKVDNVTKSSRLFAALRKTGATPRQPMFQVELVPISKGPRSFPTPDWDELDAVRKVVLGDVSPGTYRLRFLTGRDGRPGLTADRSLTRRSLFRPAVAAR